MGALADTARFHAEVVACELQSATDNPIFPGDEEETLAPHGGNLMAQQLGPASDAPSSALIVLAGLAERQMARLTDEKMNSGPPAFLQRGAEGLNSGYMGAQVTARPWWPKCGRDRSIRSRPMASTRISSRWGRLLPGWWSTSWSACSRSRRSWPWPSTCAGPKRGCLFGPGPSPAAHQPGAFGRTAPGAGDRGPG